MRRISGPRLSRRAFVSLGGALLLAGASLAPAALARADQTLRIWFIRAAHSELDVEGASRPVPDRGMSYPLTRQGLGQASALAQALAREPLSAIYTSTHLRAVQTADALAFQHRLTFTLAAEADDIDLGIPPETPLDARQVWHDLTRKWLVENDRDARHGEGESFAEVQRRFLPFVRELMNRHALDTGIVVIVSHGPTLELMLPALAPNVSAEFALRHPLPPAGIVKTELRDSRLYCTEWAGIASTEFSAGE
ncbi:MAG TPA: histidine phosphatase family protein [Steroidobacter sp.]